MNANNNQIENLRAAIKELPYQEKSIVKERAVYGLSKISTVTELVLSGFIVFTGLIGFYAGGNGVFIGLACLAFGLWQINKSFKKMNSRRPACIITVTNIEYMGKVYEWRNVTNARTYKLHGGKYERTKYYAAFDYKGDGVEINISELNTSIPSFLFQLYSHKLNYHLRYGLTEADFEPEMEE